MTLSQERPVLRPDPVSLGPGWARADGVTFLSLYLLLLFVLPSKLVVGPLGAAGAPAGLLVAVGTVWWVLTRLAGRAGPETSPASPVRTAVLLFGAAVLASYVIEASRPATGAEDRAAEVGLLLVSGWIGIVLLGGDAINERARLDRLVRRVCVAVGAMALLGLVQFFSHRTFVDALTLPGLIANNGVATLQSRDGFSRVIGTAIHPIEFGVVTSALLPLCVHQALHSVGGRLRRWGPALLVALVVPLSVSRSALVSVLVALVCAAPTWSRSLRRSALLFGGVVGCATFVLVPGMLGTLLKMFTQVSDDSSALSRTNSYSIAGDFIERSPWLGRGFMTFLPEYNTNDNQYLGLMIEVGIVGTLSMLAVFVAGIATARRVRRRAQDEATRSLGAALGASLTAIAVTFAFFDALSFPMLAGVTFLLLGITESAWRCSGRESTPDVAPRS